MQVTRTIILQFGCNRLGNPDLIFVKRISDFAFERKTQKWISLSRNPSSGWISINKSKSRFHGFPSLLFNWESERGFAKLLFWTVVVFLLIMHAGAKLLFLRTVFLNPFLDIPKETTAKKGKLKNRYLCSIKI